MKNRDKIICMIPARLGSQRLKKKNLLKINGLSLVKHSIKKAKLSNCFDETFCLTFGDEIIKNSKCKEVFFSFGLKNKSNLETIKDIFNT